MHTSKVYIERETGVGTSSEQMYLSHASIDGITELVTKGQDISFQLQVTMNNCQLTIGM